jgi:hypothetical protein
MSLSVGEATAIGIGLGNIAAWTKLIYDARKNGKNGNGRPCPLHSGLQSQIGAGEKQGADLAKELASLHTENREDHQKIFDDIKGLAIAVAGAASAAATAAVAASASRKRGKA